MSTGENGVEKNLGEVENNQLIKELIEEIKKLQNKVETLENRVDHANNVLINHIGFIDNVFNSIKRPLFFIMNKVNGLLLLENDTV
jgi:hypothetical protein